MKKSTIPLLTALLLTVFAVHAAEPTLRVAADSAFHDALGEIAPLFTDTTGFAVSPQYGDSASLADSLLADDAADVCLPADAATIDRLREKGVVDVALSRNIVVLDRPGEDPVYIRAVVLTTSPHRIQALAFLDFLVSERARGIFAAHGFALP